MEIIPAIDLRNGKCVRLYQGEYSKETVFSDDPLAIAVRWVEAGARRLHLVDLDGAVEGQLRNGSIISEIAKHTRIAVQVGGGIRDLETLEQLLSTGVQRAILGTAAIEDPELVEKACRRFGDRIIASIDVKDGYVRGRGWTEGSRMRPIEVLRMMETAGVARFIYTDIARDGTLAGPNLTGVARIKAQTAASIIVAGGISSLQDLKSLAKLDVDGAIIGRAIYTGDIDLKEAIAAANTWQADGAIVSHTNQKEARDDAKIR